MKDWPVQKRLNSESCHSSAAETFATEWTLSEATKAAIKEIDDNRRRAAVNAHNFVAGETS